MKFAVILSLLSTVLIGCSTRAPLKSVTYPEPATVSSELQGTVSLVTGNVTWGGVRRVLVAFGAYIPDSTGPAANLFSDPNRFGVLDQQTFVASLRAELERLSIVRNVEAVASDAADTLDVEINFLRTGYESDMNEYTLSVIMRLSLAGTVAEYRYQILSSDNLNFWQKMETNASEGKQLAATKLIRKVIPDIEEFIRAHAGKAGG